MSIHNMMVVCVLALKANKYVGAPYSRTKIYAARMSLPAPDLSSKPTGRCCCCRSTRQTDGRTLDRFMTLTLYYTDRVIRYKHTDRHAHHDTPLPYCGLSKDRRLLDTHLA